MLFGVVALAAVCVGQDDTAKFRYRAAKVIPVGTVLHYLKTNVTGSRPEYVSQFIAAGDVLESFKFHPMSRAEGTSLSRRSFEGRAARRPDSR